MKILFVHHKYSSTFIENDLAILRKHYEVEDFHYTIRKTLQLFRKMKNCDLIYVWFISYPAWLIGLINKLYRKKIVLIAGGYGVQSEVLEKHRLLKLISKSAIKNATAVFAVSYHTWGEVDKLEKTHSKTTVVYNGVDLTKFYDYKMRDNEKPIVLTVGIIDSWYRYYLKGIDKFLDYAKETPKAEFYIVGISEKIGKKIKDFPTNVHCCLPCSQQALARFYNHADVYCQFSKYESFSLTLLEALSCGCMVFFTPGTGMDEIFRHRNNLEKFSLENRENRIARLLAWV